MTSIVLKHAVKGHDHGEEIDVEIFNRDFEDNHEIIETNKGTYARSWTYSATSPFGWSLIGE